MWDKVETWHRQKLQTGTGIGKRQAPPAADDQQTASSVTQYPNLTHLHLNPPLSIRQASPRTTRRSSCRPCKQVRSSTARRSSDASAGPPSLITPSTPHTNIERFSIDSANTY